MRIIYQRQKSKYFTDQSQCLMWKTGDVNDRAILHKDDSGILTFFRQKGKWDKFMPRVIIPLDCITNVFKE